MQKNAMIYDELKELNSMLVKISNRNVFSVPENYFDTLPSLILQSINNQKKINELEIPVLGMKVPDGYFEGLAEQVLNKIKMEEADAVSDDEYPDFLAAVRHKNVFKVAEDYFDNLAVNILDKLPVPAKVVNMKQRPSVFKYAIAACLTGLIGLSLFSVFDKKDGRENSPPAYAKTNQVDIIQLAGDIIKNNSFDKMMESLGDDEIEGYLINDGEDINAALVASLGDEKTLPTEDDYFTDDEALEHFLIEQNIIQTNTN